jgi:hypothetical protein
MVEEPSHVKQVSLNHVCKIGLNTKDKRIQYLERKERKERSFIFSTTAKDISINIYPLKNEHVSLLKLLHL